MEAAKAAALVALTILDLRLAECGVACRFLGYDTALYEEEFCLCVDRKPYEELVNRKRIAVPKRKKPNRDSPSESANLPPYGPGD